MKGANKEVIDLAQKETIFEVVAKRIDHAVRKEDYKTANDLLDLFKRLREVFV